MKKKCMETIEKNIFIALLLVLTISCGRRNYVPQEFQYSQKMKFEDAVAILGKGLLNQLEQPWITDDPVSVEKLQPDPRLLSSPYTVAFDPFVVTQTGQQLKINYKIAAILGQEFGPSYNFKLLTPDNLTQAQYAMLGAISMRQGENKHIGHQGYDIVGVLIEYPSGLIKGKGKVSVDDLLFEPMALYEDSPIYLQDKNSRLARTLFSAYLGQVLDAEYLGFLPTKGVMQKGIQSYQEGLYEQTAREFKQATTAPDGQTLTSYAGLYLASQKIGQANEADDSFDRLISIAIEENKKLDIRLLFAVNSPAFIADKVLAQNYAMWLRYIALNMKKSNLCMAISGHSSRTGSEAYNEKLSLARAKTVQKVLAVTYPDIVKKSTVVGKGYSENIIGTGADNATDALDRRVEFKITDCRQGK